MSDYFSLERLTQISKIREYLCEEFAEEPAKKSLYDTCVDDILNDRAVIINKYPSRFKGSKLYPDYVFTYFFMGA